MKLTTRWGRSGHAPDGTLAVIGARAIYRFDQYGPDVDTPADRRDHAEVDEASHQRLVRWVIDVGHHRMMDQLKRLCVYPECDDVVAIDDGPFHLEASPQGSHGHLYIGAWLMPE